MCSIVPDSDFDTWLSRQWARSNAQPIRVFRHFNQCLPCGCYTHRRRNRSFTIEADGKVYHTCGRCVGKATRVTFTLSTEEARTTAE